MERSVPSGEEAWRVIHTESSGSAARRGGRRRAAHAHTMSARRRDSAPGLARAPLSNATPPGSGYITTNHIAGSNTYSYCALHHRLPLYVRPQIINATIESTDSLDNIKYSVVPLDRYGWLYAAVYPYISYNNLRTHTNVHKLVYYSTEYKTTEKHSPKNFSAKHLKLLMKYLRKKLTKKI